MKASKKTNNKTSLAGRPPKFSEDRRPVTVTLPVRVLDILNEIDSDRALAIAKLVDEAGRTLNNRPPVEIVEMAPQSALIVVKNSSVLRSFEGVHLIEIAPTRFLIALKKNLNVESLEIQIQDKLEDGIPSEQERKLLKDLLLMIRNQRRSRTVSKEEILIINTQ